MEMPKRCPLFINKFVISARSGSSGIVCQYQRRRRKDREGGRSGRKDISQAAKQTQRGQADHFLTSLSPVWREKRVSRMSEKVALVILSGVVKLAWFITELVVNSKAGKKFSSLLPREVLLTSLDAFGGIQGRWEASNYLKAHSCTVSLKSSSVLDYAVVHGDLEVISSPVYATIHGYFEVISSPSFKILVLI